MKTQDKAEVLKESGGLGTPCNTRAGMIEALLKRGYLIRKGKTLLSTDKGRALIAAAVEPLSNPRTDRHLGTAAP